ncbi:MAG: uroporphyrinogen decarboxylase family protein [Promethearchaeota archaeon]
MQFRSAIEKVEKIIRSPKYEALRGFWNDFYALREIKRVPIKVTLTMMFFARNLDIDLIDHYQKPEKYIEDSLKILRFQHDEVLDDRVLGGIVINFGEAFESSLFGSKPIFKSDRDALIGKPIIKTEEDLDNLNYPDFYESGLMPKIHAVYETAKRLVKGKIPVFFERWGRSPWGVAIHLRGLTQLLVDTFRNPDLVHRLLGFITESRMRWEREREKFLGVRTERGILYNDEVNAQVISPRIYQVFAHPYEQKLADFYLRGIFYFHSCGDITPFLDTIATIRGLRRLHISPATDFKTAVDKFKGKFVFEKRLDPSRDLELCDAEGIESKIREVLEVGKGTSIELDPGPILGVPLEKIKMWISLARKATTSELG